jgi:hypothetical protein
LRKTARGYNAATPIQRVKTHSLGNNAVTNIVFAYSTTIVSFPARLLFFVTIIPQLQSSKGKSIRENTKISAKKILGYYELKKNKPGFDEGCSKLSGHGKQAKLQW